MLKTMPETVSQAVFDNIQRLLYGCEGCPLMRECEDDGDNIETRYCWMIVEAAILGHDEFEQPKADYRKAKSIRYETIDAVIDLLETRAEHLNRAAIECKRSPEQGYDPKSHIACSLALTGLIPQVRALAEEPQDLDSEA